jgi:hypothetical protein
MKYILFVENNIMKVVLNTFLLVTFLHAVCSAQTPGVAINTDGSTANSSAMLDVKSTAKGMLMPRMSTAQRSAIVSPAQGLQVYDINTNSFWYYTGAAWTELTVGSGGTSYWTQDGSGNIYNNNSGKILLGTTTAGPGFLNIKSPLGLSSLFMSETGTTAADFLSVGVYAGGGTTSTRYGSLLGNFGNGFGIVNQANGPIIFQSGSSEKMRITPAGFIGINTIIPTAQLEVKAAVNLEGLTHTDGTTRLSTKIIAAGGAIGTTSNDNLIFFTNNTTVLPAMILSPAGNLGVGGSIATGSSKIEAFTANDTYGFLQSSAGGVRVGSYANATGGYYGTLTNHPLYLFSQTGNASIALLQNGNVGMGTVTPAARLNLLSNSATGFPQLLLEETDNDYARISFRTNNAANSGANFWSIAGYNNNTRASERLNFYNAAVGDVMSLSGNGNVGIGTSNPTYKLSVNGTIQTKEVRVQTGWADFVFEEEYQLNPLADVEKFIRANKHLPNIPSAKEIQIDGLALGEIQTKMMQKIEELTLYLIKANKTIEQLTQRIEIIEKGNK